MTTTFIEDAAEVEEYRQYFRQVIVRRNQRFLEKALANAEHTQAAYGTIAREFGTLELVIASFKEQNQVESACRLINAITFYMRTRGNADRQAQLLRQSLWEVKQQNSLPLMAVTQHHLGCMLVDLGNYDEAGSRFQQAVANCQKLGHKQLEAAATQQLSRLAEFRGQYLQAKSYALRCVKLCEEVGTTHTLIRALQVLGVVEHYLGAPYATSMAQFERALKLARETNDQHSIGLIQHDMGIVVQQSGDINAAKALFEQSSQANAEQLQDPHHGSTNLSQKGTIAFQQNQLELARKYLLESLRTVEESKTTHDQTFNLPETAYADQYAYSSEARAHTLQTLGMVEHKLGRFASAQSCYEEALTLSSTLKLINLQAVTLLNLGQLHGHMGNLPKAQQMLLECEALYEESGRINGLEQVSTAKQQNAVNISRLFSVSIVLSLWSVLSFGLGALPWAVLIAIVGYACRFHVVFVRIMYALLPTILVLQSGNLATLMFSALFGMLVSRFGVQAVYSWQSRRQ